VTTETPLYQMKTPMHDSNNPTGSSKAPGYDRSYGRILMTAALLAAAGCDSGGPKEAASATGSAPGTGTGGALPAGGTSSGGATNGGGGVGAMSGGAGSGGSATGGTIGSAGLPQASGGAMNGGTSSTGGGADTGGTPTSNDAGSEVTLDEFALQLADASCGALERCLGAASASYFDGGSCQSSLEPATKEGSVSAFPAAVSKGTLVYDSTKVPECLTSIRNSGCDYPNRRLGALCPDVATGKVALGGACSVNAECGAAAYCKVSACPGVCTALVAKGVACAADDDCEDGLICDATAKKCLAAGKKGSACSESAPCGTAFVCDGSAHCVEFGSVFGATEGKVCDPQGQVLCQAPLTCALVGVDTQQKGVWKCEKPPTAAACHVALPEQCSPGSYCELSGGVTGVCKPAPMASAPCASRLPSDMTVAKDICAPGLACWADGACHARAHLGQPCSADENCYSGTCITKKCAATACAP
jgi:hypothetical protein